MLQLMTALDSVSDGVMIVDDQQNIVFANSRARKLLKLTSRWRAPARCYHLLLGRNNAREMICEVNCSVVRRSKDGEIISANEIEVDIPGGGRQRLSMSVFYYRDRNDGRVYIVHFFRGIFEPERVSRLDMDDMRSVAMNGLSGKFIGNGEEALRRFAELTPRQREVLWHLLHGESTEEIAQSLSITINTARNHIQNVLQKLDVHSRMEAMAFVMRHDLFKRWRQTRWW